MDDSASAARRARGGTLRHTAHRDGRAIDATPANPSERDIEATLRWIKRQPEARGYRPPPDGAPLALVAIIYRLRGVAGVRARLALEDRVLVQRAAPAEDDDPVATRELLGRVMLVPPTLAVVRSWTPQQRREAEDWAAGEHLATLDHVPPRTVMPAFVRGAEND